MAAHTHAHHAHTHAQTHTQTHTHTHANTHTYITYGVDSELKDGDNISSKIYDQLHSLFTRINPCKTQFLKMRSGIM